MTSLSREGFFRYGVTSAPFIAVGTIPVDIDKLTMVVMVGRRHIELGVGGAEVLADVDNNEQRHDLSGSQRQ